MRHLPGSLRSISLFGILSLAIFITVTCHAEDSASLFKRATVFVSQNNHLCAITCFESIIAQYPDSAEAKQTCTALAGCYAAANRPERIEGAYLHGITHFPTDTPYVLSLRQTLGDLLVSRKEYSKAIEQFQAALLLKPDCKTAVDLYEKIVVCYGGLGDTAKAAEALQTLLAEYPKLADTYATDTANYWYYRVRTQVDAASFTARTLKRVALFYEKAGKDELASVTYQTLISQYSDSPQAITASYAQARYLDVRNRKSEAVPHYLRAIVQSAQPRCPYKALTPDNQAYLDDLNNERLAAPEVRKAVGELCACLNQGRRRDATLSETDLRAVQSLWETAPRCVENSQYDTATHSYQEIATKTEGDIRLLAVYLTAVCYQQQGYTYDTVTTLEPWLKGWGRVKPATPGDSPVEAFRKTLTVYARELAATAHFRQGNYRRAEELLTPLAEFSSADAYRLAQCYEFQGKTNEALKTYRRVLAMQDKDAAEFSRCAVQRVSSLGESISHLARQSEPAVLYAGEDRVTGGDWQITKHKDPYPNSWHLLCGMGGYGSTEVSWGLHIPYREYIPRADDTARLWTTTGDDPSPSVLTNPVTKKRMMSNWDDHGEIYPRGTGPDLLGDFAIPEGIYRFSLYFVNDHNYYEPNRRYTVYVMDRQGRTVAGTYVEDFLHGVYKHFVVYGPCTITVRMCRDLSLNTLLSGVFADRLLPLSSPPFADQRSGPRELMSEYAGLQRRWETDPKGFLADRDRAERLMRKLQDFLSRTAADAQRRDVSWCLASLAQCLWHFRTRDSALGIYASLCKRTFAQERAKTSIEELFPAVEALATTPWVNEKVEREIVAAYMDALIAHVPRDQAVPSLMIFFFLQNSRYFRLVAEKMVRAYPVADLERLCGKFWTQKLAQGTF